MLELIASCKAKTFKDLGIEPVDIKTMLYEYLVRSRIFVYPNTTNLNIERIP